MQVRYYPMPTWPSQFVFPWLQNQYVAEQGHWAVGAMKMSEATALGPSINHQKNQVC